MSVYQGDFLGFQFGDEHSYNLNITHVSSGDRYSDILIPTFQDQTVQVPGGDGTYYWDSYYTQKQFTVDFAFDNLRDEDLRALRRMFGSKEIKPLIFDEFPYKKYMVKCAQPPTLKYICFDHQEFRIYKGEGQVQFVAYYPFAFSTAPPTVPVARNVYGVINNVGDLPANLEMRLSLDDIMNWHSQHNTYNIILKLGSRSGTNEENAFSDLGIMTLQGDMVALNSADEYILINTQTQLIEGLNQDFEKTHTLYNKYIVSGDFFYPPPGRSYLACSIKMDNVKYTPMYY